MTTQDWIEIGKGLATLLVALLAGRIAWRQAETARDKLKFDLFDRRMAVYSELMQPVGVVSATQSITEEQFFKLNAAAEQCQWLFNKKFCELATKAAMRAIVAYHATHEENLGRMTPKQKNDRDAALAEIKVLYPKLIEAASPDLRLKH